MKAFLISDNVDTATGMRLAGVDGEVVHEREEFRAALDRALANKDYAVIFVTELLSKNFPEVAGAAKENTAGKLILEIPDRHGSMRRADFITAYINEAIGVKL